MKTASLTLPVTVVEEPGVLSSNQCCRCGTKEAGRQAGEGKGW